MEVERLSARVEADTRGAERSIDRLDRKLDEAAKDRVARIRVVQTGSTLGGAVRPSASDRARAQQRDSGGRFSGGRNGSGGGNGGGVDGKKNGGFFDGMTRSILKAKSVLGSLNLVFGAMKFSLLIGGAAQAAVAITALGGAAIALLSSLGPLTGLVGLLPGAFLGLAVGALAVVPAFAGFTKGLGSLVTAQDDAQKNALSLIQAQHGLTSAELIAARATRDYANARRDAAEAIEDAQFGAADAQINEERSVMALKSAYERLADVQAGIAGKTEEMTKVTDDFTGKQFEVARITYTAADRQADLQDALLGVREAELAVARAKDANQDAQINLNEVQSKGIANSDIMIDRQAALESAILGVAQAQTTLAEAQGAASGEGTKEFKKLTPAAQRFAKTLLGMRGQWQRLKDSTSGALFPGLTDGVTAGGGIIDAILPGLTKVSSAIGNVGRQFGKMLGDKKVQKDLNRFITGFAGHIRIITPGLVSVGKAFIGIAIAAKPLADFLVGAFARGADKFAEWVQTGRDTGKLEAFFERTVQALKDWGSILGNIGGGFAGIFRAASPLGQSLVGSMIEVTQRFETWTNSDAGQSKLSTFFASIRGTISGMVGLIGSLGLAWGRLFTSPEANKGTQMVLGFFQNAVPYVEEFISMFMKSELFQAFADAIVPIGKVLWAVFGPTGIAALVVRILGKIATGFLWMTNNVPGFATVLGTLVTAFAAFKVLQSVIGMVKAFNLVLKANPYVAIAAAVIAIGILIYKNWDKIKKFLIPVWNWIKKQADVIWNSGIVKVIRKAVMTLVSVVMTGVNAIIKVWKFLWPAIETVAKLIIASVKFLWKMLKLYIEIGIEIVKGLAWVWENVLWPVISKVVGWIVGLLSTIWDGLTAAWDIVWGVLTTTWSGLVTAVTSWVITPVAGIFSTIWDGITGAWDAIWTTLTGIWTTLVDDVTKWIITPLANVFSGMWEGMKTGLVAAVNFIVKILNGVIDGLNLLNPFEDIPYIPTWDANGNKVPLTNNRQSIVVPGTGVNGVPPQFLPGTVITPVDPSTMPVMTSVGSNGQPNMSANGLPSSIAAPSSPVVINQTFMEHQDPHAIASQIAWRLS